MKIKLILKYIFLSILDKYLRSVCILQAGFFLLGSLSEKFVGKSHGHVAFFIRPTPDFNFTTTPHDICIMIRTTILTSHMIRRYNIKIISKNSNDKK